MGVHLDLHFLSHPQFFKQCWGCCCGIWVCSCESLWQHTYTNLPNYNSLSNNLSSSRWQIHTHIHTTTQNNQILGCLESRVLDLQLSLYLPFHMIFKFIAPQQQTTTTSSWMRLCGPMRKSSKYSWCTSLLTCLYKGPKFGSPQLCQSCWVHTTYPASPVQTKQNKTMGASPHSLALPFYIKKKYLKAKEDLLLWKLKYFTMQKYNLSKTPHQKKIQNII